MCVEEAAVNIVHLGEITSNKITMKSAGIS